MADHADNSHLILAFSTKVPFLGERKWSDRGSLNAMNIKKKVLQDTANGDEVEMYGRNVADLRMSIHDSIHLIHREDWEELAKDAELYLRYDHLAALEDRMSGSMGFRYVLYYCPEYRPKGIAYFQLVDLVDNGSKYRDAVARLGNKIGSRIVNEFKVRSLVCGNVFHCGDHGAYFVKGMALEMRLSAVEATMRRLKGDDRLLPKVSMLMFKEFWPHQFTSAQVLSEMSYEALAMDVNMVLEMDPSWVSLETYLAELTSKARTRIRSILKRSDTIEIRDMDAAAIQTETDRMQELFDQVLDRSPFIFGRLDVAVYAAWKKQLGDDMLFHGFYLNDELVGFNTAFVLTDALDAHYVGIDHGLNKEHMIYQRMLIDLLEFAIAKGLPKINFGRTAEQAKSSIGAKPVDMLFYVRHRNRIANALISPLIRSVRPSTFESRSPFKQTRD